MQVNCLEKLISWENLPEWRAALRPQHKRLVVTNGCFDLLHAGHVLYLQTARNLGDALLVGLNSDESVRRLKGEGRPLNTQEDRAIVLASLQTVTGVCIFNETGASRFLEFAQPDVYVKGGDYTLDTLNQEERKIVEQRGGEISIVPFLPGRSTTGLLQKLTGL